MEGDIRQAAAELGQPAKPIAAADSPMAAPRPAGAFAQAVSTLADTLSRGVSIAVARITLTGFDTHGNQPPTQARLLAELADGIALCARNCSNRDAGTTPWCSATPSSAAARENGNRGTDHGTANVHFASGGRVRGGLYGQSPQLAGVSDGNLPYAIDFRQVYATAIQSWWGKDAHNALGGRFTPAHSEDMKKPAPGAGRLLRSTQRFTSSWTPTLAAKPPGSCPAG